jgi:two-component system chemotaxis response regulator CheY
MRALLVDDSSVVLLCLKGFLSKYSECDLARGGPQGWDAFQRSLQDRRYYDLICLDLQMPGIDGLTLLGRIRAREQELQIPSRSKILIITGTTDTDAIVRIKNEGADGYLLKPVSGDKLRDQLLRLGLITLSSGAKAEKLADELTELTDSDDIPPPILARLIRRMAVSLERQTLRDAASLARAGTRIAPEEEKQPEEARKPLAAFAALR